MIESVLLSWTLAVLFAGTAMYSLVWCGRTYATATASALADERAIELFHLLMSVAMVAMVWMWGGVGAQTVQLLVFGAFTVLFVLRGASMPRAAGPREGTGFGYHALMAGSMTWMVAAMSTMTGHEWATSGSGTHNHGADASAGTGAVSDVSAPGWTVVITLVLVVGLTAAAVSWARTARGAKTRVPVSVGVGAGDGATGAERPAARPDVLFQPRVAALCHMLMSIGMAVMLLAMI